LQEEQPGNPQAGKQGTSTFRPSTMNSCALDVAAQPQSFDAIGEMLGMHPTRVRQIAEQAIEKISAYEPELAAALLERL
jgi:hypothetical protein